MSSSAVTCFIIFIFFKKIGKKKIKKINWTRNTYLNEYLRCYIDYMFDFGCYT